MNRNKNILIDCHVFDDGYQGSRTFIKEIYSRYPNPKKLYLAAYDTLLLSEEFPKVPAKNIIKLRSKSNLLRLLILYPYIILKYKIDIAHFQYVVPPLKLCKYVVTIHDLLFIEYPEYFPFYYRFMRKWTFWLSSRLSEVITTVSQYSKSSIQHHFNVPSKKIVITKNGVTIEQNESISKSEARSYIEETFGCSNIILYVSRVEPRKNHILLISAFVELELYKKGYQLVLIGDDAITQKSLKSYLASLSNNESDSIKWLRKVSNADLSNFYSAAKLFVYPSLFEGFGIPPLEAVAKKVTTLCSNTTSMIDFDFLGANQFNPMDKSILKRLILSNIENGPSEEEKEKYIRIIKENYSWSKTVSIFENIFMYKL